MSDDLEERTYIVTGRRLIPFSEHVVGRTAANASDRARKGVEGDGHEFICFGSRVAEPSDVLGDQR